MATGRPLSVGVFAGGLASAESVQASVANSNCLLIMPSSRAELRLMDDGVARERVPGRVLEHLKTVLALHGDDLESVLEALGGLLLEHEHHRVSYLASGPLDGWGVQEKAVDLPGVRNGELHPLLVPLGIREDEQGIEGIAVEPILRFDRVRALHLPIEGVLGEGPPPFPGGVPEGCQMTGRALCLMMGWVHALCGSFRMWRVRGLFVRPFISPARALLPTNP